MAAVTEGGDGAEVLPAPAFMSALVTEHFALQPVSRATISESGSRAALYLSSLSSGLVAIGFASSAHRSFAALACTVLPTVFVLGWFTKDVFAKPSPLDFAQAANLLLVGTTASEMLHAADVQAGDLVLLHGAAGAVGTSVLQRVRLRGAQVIGTAAPANFAAVRRYGAIPVQYGPGLEQRVRGAAPGGVTAALDTVGTDEAIDVSQQLVADRRRIVTIAAPARAQRDHIRMLGATNPASGPYRAAHRAAVLELAAQGRLEVPIAATYPVSEAPAALDALLRPHGHGKLALLI